MILDDITAAVAKRIEQDKQRIPPEEMKRRAADVKEKKDFPFERALSHPGISFICEVKRASPSKGLIAAQFPYMDIAREYEAAGAAAISVLTERDYFQGSGQYLQHIAAAVATPVIRKDFILDAYQIYEARVWGASAILLICAILEDERLVSFFHIADSLGLSVLVEAHDAGEIQRAVRCGARVIGVNNRNLKNFTVSLDTSCRLRPLVPKECLFVAESGIRTAADVSCLQDNGVDAVLIGETLMRSPDKKAMLHTLAGGRHG